MSSSTVEIAQRAMYLNKETKYNICAIKEADGKQSYRLIKLKYQKTIYLILWNELNMVGRIQGGQKCTEQSLNMVGSYSGRTSGQPHNIRGSSELNLISKSKKINKN